MTIGEWIEHVEQYRTMYQEGAITASEYVISVVASYEMIPDTEFEGLLEIPKMIDESKFPSKQDFIEQWVGKELPKA